MCLLEAMAYGNCCITSDIPECADVLAGNGVTFAKGSATDLERALADVLANPAKAEHYGNSAREHVEATYDWDSVVERTVALYEGESK